MTFLRSLTLALFLSLFPILVDNFITPTIAAEFDQKDFEENKNHEGYFPIETFQNWTSTRYVSHKNIHEQDYCLIYSHPVSAFIKQNEIEKPRPVENQAAFVNWYHSIPTSRAGEISFIVGRSVQEPFLHKHFAQFDNGDQFWLTGMNSRLFVPYPNISRFMESLNRSHKFQIVAFLEDGTISQSTYSTNGFHQTFESAYINCNPRFSRFEKDADSPN